MDFCPKPSNNTKFVCILYTKKSSSPWEPLLKNFLNDAFLYYSHLVALADHSPMQNLGEDTLGRHDTFTHGVVDLASVVALLAYLGNLKKNFAAGQAGSYRQGGEVNLVDDQVFSETAFDHNGSSGLESLNFIMGEQAHLPVPVPGMSVVFKAVVFNQQRGPHILFCSPFFFACAYSYYFTHGELL